jgi:hypothetical protein
MNSPFQNSEYNPDKLATQRTEDEENLNTNQLRIDRNFGSVHEEIT